MPHLFPCGLTRRELLWEMGGGFAGVALAGLLAQDAHADSPLAAKKPHYAGKAKACIFLMMNGGPSQVDTFDPKPALEKFSGTELPKDKKFINSGGRKVGFLTPAFRKFKPAALPRAADTPTSPAMSPGCSPASRRSSTRPLAAAREPTQAGKSRRNCT